MSALIGDLFESDIAVDLFAGGGGASVGTEAATKRPVDIAINHDEVAIAVHRANHPRTAHYTADVFAVDPNAAVRGRHVRHLHASPDCRHHSRAAGGAPRSASVRSLADVVIDWAEAVRPDVITLENVPEFEEWGPIDEKGRAIKERKGEDFARWLGELQAAGYRAEHRVLHAHHYGAPTSRKRFFLVARRDGKPIAWPPPTHGPGLRRYRTAAECIDWSLPCPSIFERKKPLVPATLRRIAAGVVRFVLESPRPFIVSIDHRGSARSDRTVDAPLSTISTKARHCLVTAFLAQHYQGQVGHVLRKPLPTITTVDHHSLVAVGLADPGIEASDHRSEIRGFLAAYYGSGSGLVGHSLHAPTPTITTRDRFALVTVVIDGGTYALIDIGMRMLEPHELLKAQFGRFARGYDLSAARTKKDQVRLIGNSVAPQMQEAVVRANLCSREAA